MLRGLGLMVASILFAAYSSTAYTLEWAVMCPGTTDLYPHDNTTDAAGNVYNAGRYTGTVDLDPSAGVSSFTANGFTDAFIQKLDNAGNFLWVINFTGGTWEQISSLTCDPSGNLYAFGYFNGTVDFDPGPAVFSLTSGGGYDLVLLKYSAAGNLVWAKSLGAAGNDEGLIISIDAGGNVYCGGLFSLTVDFDPGPGTNLLTAVGGQDVFIARFDPAGNLLWARSYGTPNNDNITGLDVNTGGDVIVTGSFSGSGDFNPDAGVQTLTAVAFSDIYFLKLNAFGNYLWCSSIGSPGFDYPNDVCFTSGNDLLVVGGFNNATDFDPGPGVNTLTPSSLDGYLLKLDAAGMFLWVKQFSGYSIIPGKVEVNPAGKIFLTGSFDGTVDFDPDLGVVSGVSGNTTYDAFVLRLDQTGAYEWHLDPEGTLNFDQIWTLSINPAGDVFFMGRFYGGTIDLLQGPGVMALTNTSPTSANGYFFKLDAGSPLPVSATPLTGNVRDGYAHLSWTTFWEVNNEGYWIYRSPDGIHWNEIGFVEGQGTIHQTCQYSFHDKNILTETTYYRYIQRDFNGQEYFSSIIALSPDVISGKVSPYVYPNPGPGECYINNIDVSTTPVSYRILNSQGGMVSSGAIHPQDGIPKVSIPGPDGNYFITLHMRGKNYQVAYLKRR